jgi:hypothetical protein
VQPLARWLSCIPTDCLPLQRAPLRRVLRAQAAPETTGLALTWSHLLLFQRSPVQANSSTSKTAGAPAGTVPQQLQVHSVQQSVPVTQEVPGQSGQQQGRGVPGSRPLQPPLAVSVACGNVWCAPPLSSSGSWGGRCCEDSYMPPSEQALRTALRTLVGETWGQVPAPTSGLREKPSLQIHVQPLGEAKL